MWDNIKYNADGYCCEHFLIDAYRYYTDIDLTPKLLTKGFFNIHNLRNFKQADKPKQYTIVLLRSKGKAHVGLWVNGRVLHLDSKGVVWQSLNIVKQGFERVTFYEIV